MLWRRPGPGGGGGEHRHLESAQALLLTRQVLRVLNLQRQRLAVLVARQQAEGCSALHQLAQVGHHLRIF
jgi:hypothetical protein